MQRRSARRSMKGVFFGSCVERSSRMSDLGIPRAGFTDDGLGADGGGVRDRVTAHGTQARTNPQAGRRPGVPEARGDGERVFLGLVPQDRKTWANVPRSFRWVLGEYLDLPFEDYATVHGRLTLETRRLQPDAILEVPGLKKRFFIEYETGSATVRDAKKSTSTMAKLDRYGNFLCAPVGDVLGGGLVDTAYTRAFSDGWSAEVLFVTQTEARRDSITGVIAERERSDKWKLAARVLTLEESHRALCRALYGAEQPPGVVRHAARIAEPAPAPTIWPTDAPARTASEERLRRGRVSVRGEQLVMLEKLLRNSLDALSSAVDVLTRMRLPPSRSLQF